MSIMLSVNEGIKSTILVSKFFRDIHRSPLMYSPNFFTLSALHLPRDIGKDLFEPYDMKVLPADTPIFAFSSCFDLIKSKSEYVITFDVKKIRAYSFFVRTPKSGLVDITLHDLKVGTDFSIVRDDGARLKKDAVLYIQEDSLNISLCDLASRNLVSTGISLKDSGNTYMAIRDFLFKQSIEPIIGSFSIIAKSKKFTDHVIRCFKEA